MRKIIWGCIIISMMLFCIGCGQESSLENTNSSQAGVEQETPQTESENETVESQKQSVDVEEQISDIDIQKEEMMLEILWNTYKGLRQQAESYDELGHGLTEEEMQELIQSEIIRCYEENTLLAVEIKTLVAGSVGVSVPTGFATGDVALDNYADYVKDTVTGMLTSSAEGVISDIAGDEVKDILKDGVGGAVEAYRNNGTLEEVLEGASSSVTDGVIAKVQGKISEQVTGILDETTGGLYSVLVEIQQYSSISDYLSTKADEKTGGLIGTIAGIAGYDSTPGALLQSISNSANDSAAVLKNFLNKEMINSRDISEMMYSFSAFEDSMQTLASYGVQVNFSGQGNYEKMEILYEQFAKNEVMIEMLSSKGDLSAPQIDNSMLYELPETASTTYLYDEPGLTQEEQGLSNSEKYQILTQQKKKLESAVEELKGKVARTAELDEKFQNYRKQVSNIKTGCSNLLEYNVNNFTAGYDSDGLQQMEQFNSVSNIIGEIAKFTPYGLFTNLMTSQAIANTDDYFTTMQDINETFAEAYSKLVLEARDAVAELESHIAVYNDLVKETDDIKTEFRNLCFLQYLLGDSEIEVTEYRADAEKKLYLLALQIDIMGKIYNTIYEDASFTSIYTAQYNEIMSIVDPLSIGGMEGKVSTEELSEALVPILQAGVRATDAMSSTLNSPYDERFIMIYGGEYAGKAYYLFSHNGTLMRTKHPCFSVYYFLDGEPYLINGLYIYNGRILNGTEEMDAEAIVEEGKWFDKNYANSNFSSESKQHIKTLKSLCGN